MSLTEFFCWEGGADDDAEPEDLPNLVRRSAAPHGGSLAPLHPAMDRTAGFFRVKNVKPRLPWTGFLRERAHDEGGEMCILGSVNGFVCSNQGGTWK